MGWFRFSYRFILLPSFAALACYACQPVANTAPTASSAPLRELSVTETGPVEAGATSTESADKTPLSSDTETRPVFSVSASSSAYQEGINLASSAHALSQSALSPDDWGLIASRWERAATQLKKVDSQHIQYEQAQQKAQEYALNAEAAKAQIAELQAPVYIPLPAEASRPAVSIGLGNGPSPNTPVASASLGPTQIPIVRRLHGTPIVRVTFNRSRTYEMILDTGASRTLITRQMAQDLGVVTTERMIAATASQAEVSFDIGRVDTMSMGDVVLENARVSIGDSVNIGLLGNDFLRDYDVTIRAQTGVVELSRSN